MKDVLFASYDMEVGGVERSLINLLDHFDYTNHKVDLMLYRHQGDFMNDIYPKVNVLKEVSQYATFRMPVTEILNNRHYTIGLTRIYSKLQASLVGKVKGKQEIGYYQMQLMWKYAFPFLPKLKKHYDVAISYLWPHDFIAKKVTANQKIAWIHTDYSTIETDNKLDLKVWDKFDQIVAVSETCKEAFLKKYPQLKRKIIVIENINSPGFIREKAVEGHNKDHPMLSDKRFKLVTVARLSHAKGIDQAVKAFRLLKNRGYQNLVWYIVGYGGDEEIIRRLIEKNNLTDSFVLLGKKTNPYPYIQSADLYVQPSRYEGKAVTVTEAQILGKPILITNYQTAKSQIRDQVDGYITELSVEGIANGIEDLYNNHILRTSLAATCKNSDYSNTHELEKLYKIMNGMEPNFL
ncbi:glycosyltransferase involved in cell wall biosynthesis [Pullulanibacillus pueri]|uniref:Glycosyl transferase n=1 Tax=Pullulanibacillus pueri TaxID=1437324 RepID=A0A8J2ZVL9_9BACL|nr:glycosyltransferase [Pullulanibacillus pueri]MBM7682432.1 glycosyltransferase involved in cell wall biosynthesis [Pullulanibacillus pueri]GGH81661.1 glycosyl transferase [Pullulanibacillus pueri]